MFWHESDRSNWSPSGIRTRSSSNYLSHESSGDILGFLHGELPFISCRIKNSLTKQNPYIRKSHLTLHVLKRKADQFEDKRQENRDEDQKEVHASRKNSLLCWKNGRLYAARKEGSTANILRDFHCFSRQRKSCSYAFCAVREPTWNNWRNTRKPSLWIHCLLHITSGKPSQVTSCHGDHSEVQQRDSEEIPFILTRSHPWTREGLPRKVLHYYLSSCLQLYMESEADILWWTLLRHLLEFYYLMWLTFTFSFLTNSRTISCCQPINLCNSCMGESLCFLLLF